MKYLRVILIVLLLGCCTLLVASYWNIEYLPPHGELGINLFSGRIGINNFNGDIVNRGFGVVEVHGSHTFWWPIFGGNLDHSLWFFDCALWLPTLLLALPLVISASPWARRRRRAKKGLCIKCGYDLSGSESGVCSECGARAG